MLKLSWRLLWSRWTAFVGTFIALSLGVCLMTIMLLSLAATISDQERSSQWYTHADVVVTGSNTVTFARQSPTITTPEARPVPADVVERLASIEGVALTVVDRRIPIGVDGIATSAHPWASVMLHPYTFVTGTPPTADNQVVLTAPTTYRPGDHITVQTPDGPYQWTVVGIIQADIAALYLTNTQAAQLASDRIDAIGLLAADNGNVQTLAEHVRQAVRSDELRVLTDTARSEAEPNPDAQLLIIATALLANAAGISGFASIFVVLGTFSFAVAQRRREFALLRTTGATPGQVLRLVLEEAIGIGLLAALVGCAAGVLTAPLFAHWFASTGLAPASFTISISLWPLAGAGGSGLVVALSGASLAAIQASRVPPLEALQEAAVDQRLMTAGRWISGLIFLAGGISIIPVIMGFQPGPAISMTLAQALLMLAAAALLSPALIAFIIRMVSWPLRRGISLLARSSALNGIRRSSATASSILITVGLAASTFISFMTLSEAGLQASRDRITATVMMVPTTATGISDQTLTVLSGVTGIRAVVPTRQSTAYLDPGQSGGSSNIPAIYVNHNINSVLHLPALAGSFADLQGTDTVAVSEKMAKARNWQIGDTIQVWLADSTPARLHVVTILPDSIDLGGTLFLPWELGRIHEARTGADTVYLLFDKGSSTSTVMAQVEQIARSAGGHIVTVTDHLTARYNEENHIEFLGIVVTIGLTLLYTSIAIANTFVMATADRVRDFAVLRLNGTTSRQVLHLTAVETLLATIGGTVLAAVIAAGVLATVLAYLGNIMEQPQASIPWMWICLIVGCCLIVALLASLISAALVLRTPAARLTTTRE